MFGLELSSEIMDVLVFLSLDVIIERPLSASNYMVISETFDMLECGFKLTILQMWIILTTSI
jgi:hypothetical protein